MWLKLWEPGLQSVSQGPKCLGLILFDSVKIIQIKVYLGNMSTSNNHNQIKTLKEPVYQSLSFHKCETNSLRGSARLPSLTCFVMY